MTPNGFASKEPRVGDPTAASSSRRGVLDHPAILALGMLFFLTMIVLNVSAVLGPSLPWTALYAFNVGWMGERLLGGQRD